MGRTKQYNRDDLIDQAIQVFWRNGYAGTSMAVLVEALGINRKSLYTEFGSKQGIYEAALERYDELNLSMVLRRVESESAGIPEIKMAFDGYASASEGNMAGLGCFLCNASVERAALEDPNSAFADAYLARVRAAFRNALANAAGAGQLRPESDVEQLAEFLTTALIGFAACVRAEAPPEQMWASSRVVSSVLDAHHVSA